MVVAIDVGYGTDSAKAVGVLFDWAAEENHKIIIENIEGIEDYIPGSFYLRELPCIMALLKLVDITTINTIIIDGYVYVDDAHTYGLGAKLWEALGGKVEVIGAAKTRYHHVSKSVAEVFRGESKNPLFVSAIGCNIEQAALKIQNMQGQHRIPTLLKKADSLTRSD